MNMVSNKVYTPNEKHEPKHGQHQCMVTQILNLRPHFLKSIVHVIKFVTNRKYAF